MDINNIVLKILFLFLPGIIATLIFRQLKANKVKKDWEDFIEIFLFTIFSYFIYFGVILLCNLKIPEKIEKNKFEYEILQNIDLTSDTVFVLNNYKYDQSSDSYKISKKIDKYNYKKLKKIYILSKSRFSQLINLSSSNILNYWSLLFEICLLSIVVSILASLAYNYKIINKLGRKLNLTKSFGDDDVWEFLHNSPELEWVYIRDLKNNLTYYGKILAFSTTDKKREILLTNVSVFQSSSSKNLYDMEAIYFSKDDYDFIIEIPVFSDSIPEEINVKEFNDKIFNKISNKKHQKFLLKYYKNKNEKYVLIENLNYKKRLKIRKILEEINYLVYNINKG